jgi:hypothetical protein
MQGKGTCRPRLRRRGWKLSAAAEVLNWLVSGSGQAGEGPEDHTVESVRGAVPVLPRARFPGPLAAPGVRVSTHRALHGSCRQAGLGSGQGVGILLPR